MNWGAIGEQYAADKNLSLADIARMTGRRIGTVKSHHARAGWAELRRVVQAKTCEAIREKLQREQEKFALFRQRKLITIARRSLNALAENLKAPGGEHGHGSDKVDAYQLQATLKTLDDGTLAEKVSEKLTPLILEAMSDQSVSDLATAKLKAFREALQSQPAATASTTSTRKPDCATGRAASSFSRSSGGS